MKPLPQTPNPLVLRTDFSNQAAWEAIRSAIRQPVGDFYAYVDFLEDVEYADMTKDQLMEAVSQNYAHSFIIVADRTTTSHPDYALLVVELYQGSGREFRAVPAQIQSIQNN